MRKLVAAILLVLICAQCTIAAPLSGEETVELAKYVQELEAENESLKKQIEILQGGMNKMNDLSIKVDVQTQALIAKYEHSMGIMDKLLLRYEESLLRSDKVIDRLERKLENQKTMNTIFQILAVGGVAYAASK